MVSDGEIYDIEMIRMQYENFPTPESLDEAMREYSEFKKQYASMLREHARSIREQLKLLDKRKG
jgi:hypothetical protein